MRDKLLIGLLRHVTESEFLLKMKRLNFREVDFKQIPYGVLKDTPWITGIRKGESIIPNHVALVLGKPKNVLPVMFEQTSTGGEFRLNAPTGYSLEGTYFSRY